MKNLAVFLMLTILVSCSGGGEGSNPIANAYIEDIESEIEDFEKVNQVIESQNTIVELIQPNNIDRDFDLQVSPVINENNEPTIYIISHKREKGLIANEPFSVFKLNLNSEQVTPYSSQLTGKLGRYRNIFSNKYIVTQTPINILELTGGELIKKQTPFEGSYRINHVLKHGNNICGLARKKNTPFYAFNYNVSSDQIAVTGDQVTLPMSGKLTRAISCLDNMMLILMKSDTELKIYSYSFSTSQFSELLDIQDLASRVSFIYRDGAHYVAIRDSLKQWTRYSTDGAALTSVTSIPRGTHNPFITIRRFISLEDSSTEDPHYTIQIDDRKKVFFENNKKIKVSSGYDFNPVARKIIKKDGRLFIVSKRNVIYEYDKAQRKFIEFGNPLAFGVFDLTFKNDDMYLVVAGNRLLKYDPSTPWTYGKLEYRHIKRNQPGHNPMIMKTFDQNNFKAVNQIKNIDNILYFKADFKDKLGSLLFNFDFYSDSIASSYQSHQDLNISGFKFDGSNFEVMTRFNKRRADVEEGLVAKYITLDSSLSETKAESYVTNGTQAHNRHIIDGKVFFQYGRGLYTYDAEESKAKRIHLQNGLRGNVYIKAPNYSFVYISDGKVRMFNPLTKIEVDLYVIPEELNITRVTNLKLFNNSLFFLDRAGVVNEITLKYADLNLQDKQE